MQADRPEQTGREIDAQLVERVRHGDRCAFTALLRHWEQPVLRIAYRITGDLAEAEDVRQEVFLRLLGSPRALRRPQWFAAWMRRVTINTAISALRRRKRRKRLAARLRQMHSDPDVPAPWQAHAAAEDVDRLALALAELTPADRALLALRFDEALTFGEIGQALAKPASTVKSRYRRAIQRLRASLESERQQKRGADHERPD